MDEFTDKHELVVYEESTAQVIRRTCFNTSTCRYSAANPG